MITQLAIGDAYGAAFEFASEGFIERENDGARYHQHPTKRDVKPGCYTDDTQMSLAIAEAIIAGDEWTPLALANRFVGVYKRDPRPGYAAEFQKFLDSVKDGEEFLRRIRPDSDRNGAAMRSAPIGVFREVREVIDRATVQAKITHDTPEGVLSAQAAALMSHYFLHDARDKAGLPAFLNRHVRGDYDWGKPWRGRVGLRGRECVHAAVTALVANNSLTELLRSCVRFGGDTDTTATIALAAAAHAREYRQDLSRALRLDLEDTRYGRRYLARCDAELVAVVRRPAPKRWLW